MGFPSPVTLYRIVAQFWKIQTHSKWLSYKNKTRNDEIIPVKCASSSLKKIWPIIKFRISYNWIKMLCIYSRATLPLGCEEKSSNSCISERTKKKSDTIHFYTSWCELYSERGTPESLNFQSPYTVEMEFKICWLWEPRLNWISLWTVMIIIAKVTYSPKDGDSKSKQNHVNSSHTKLWIYYRNSRGETESHMWWYDMEMRSRDKYK